MGKLKKYDSTHLEGLEDHVLAVSELELTVVGDLDVAVLLELKVQLVRGRDLHLVAHRNQLPFPEMRNKIVDKVGGRISQVV